MATYNDYQLVTPDNTNLTVRDWQPQKAPEAIILHVHGLGEHSGRMDHWAERFNKQNIAFISYDQRGHGLSKVKKGGPGNADLLLKDVQQMIDKIKSDYPELPLILYGHSMGGNIVINYGIKNSKQLKGLIATSPWLKLKKQPSKATITLAGILGKIAPGITISNGLNVNDISSDKTEVEKYEKDPLVHDKICFGLFNSIYKNGISALNNATQITCPMLLMHGTADNITSAEASEEFARQANDNVELKLWEKGFHELHHEPLREEMFEYIINWMKKCNLI